MVDSMVQVILIRPGSTDFDDQGRIQGTLNIPLNAIGSSEVAATIEQLRDKGIESLYCCESEPALETARSMAAALGAKLKKLDHMENLDHGLWQGMRIGEVKRKHPKLYRQWQEHPENVRPPEGETVSEARDRVTAAINKLVKKHKKGVIGLVAPEPLARVVKSCLQNCEVGDMWKANDGRGHWEVIEVRPKALAHSS